VSAYPVTEMGLDDCRRLTDAIELLREMQRGFPALIAAMSRADWIETYDLASAAESRMVKARDLLGDLALTQSSRNIHRSNVEAAEKFDEFTGPM